MPISFYEAGFSVVSYDSMNPSVWIAPPVDFIVHCYFRYLGGLFIQLTPEGFNIPLQLSDNILHFHHGGVLGGHEIGVFCNLSNQVHVCDNDVSNFCPVFRCCLH